jgi:hypothetical protein
MPIPNRNNLPSIVHSEQTILNQSFDEEFNVLANEGISYNPVSGNLERDTKIQGNASIVITYNASNQPTNIAKTIGSTTYNKTLTWTGSVCTAISAWS